MRIKARIQRTIPIIEVISMLKFTKLARKWKGINIRMWIYLWCRY